MVRLTQAHRVYGRKYRPGDDVSHFPRHYLAILVRRGIAERAAEKDYTQGGMPDYGWTVAEIRQWLSDRGESTHGTKKELLEKVDGLHNAG